MADTPIVSIGANCSVTNFNFCSDSWRSKLSTKLGPYTNMSDGGYQKYKDTIKQASGSWTGFALDDGGLPIGGGGGNALVTGHTFVVQGWTLNFNVPVTDTTGGDAATGAGWPNWATCDPMGMDVDISVAGYGITEGGVLPAGIAAGTTAQVANLRLGATPACFFTFTLAEEASVDYARALYDKYYLGLTFKAHGPFTMTWPVNPPFPAAALDAVTGHFIASNFKTGGTFTYDTPIAGAKSQNGTICVVSLSLTRSVTPGQLLRYGANWVSSGTWTLQS